jgi:ATP-dependent protease ClpP protease subunit
MPNSVALLRAANLSQRTNRLAALLINGWDPRSTPCFRVENADAERAKLYVYDVIGGWDLDAAQFVQAVHAIKAPAIDMHINSPGGFVFDAVSMFEAVAAHPAEVTTHVDGLAASAASFLALAGDTVETAKGSRWMIHDAQGIALGSPADLREYADLLDAVSDDISGYYADRAGGKPEMWRAAMQATTWYSAQQSVDAGLADRVTGATQDPEPDNRASAITTTDGPDNRTRLIQARQRALAAQGG